MNHQSLHPSRPSPFKVRALLAALGASSLLLAAPATIAAPGDGYQPYWQQSAVNSAAPTITDFDVDPVNRLEPGRTLEFTVRGTPRSEVWVHVEGGSNALTLSEVSPGTYRGGYTIGAGDRILPGSRVSAQLRHDRQIDTAWLGEPVVRGARWQPVANVPLKIERLSVQHEGERRVGSIVHMQLEGTPGGRAWAQLPGQRAPQVNLTEVRPGLYRASYTVQRADRLNPDGPVKAYLRVGERTTTASIDDALDEKRRGGWRQAAVDCARCGTVTEITVREVKGEAGAAGTVAGGVLGAVIGSQVGKGDGRTAAGVAGAIGGALLGREIERRQGRDEVYEVAVRMSDGHVETVRYDDPPPFRVGDRVRLEGDGLEMASLDR